MSEYIVDIPSTLNRDGVYYPDERNDPMPVYEEVVRCRDCAKADYAEVHMFDGTRPRKWTCTRFKGFHHMVQPDDFCSRGVRREP